MADLDSSAITFNKPRVLACLLCQQRKVKCNRVYPCQTCLKVGVQCIPASMIPPKPRRRRFAERELLERIRRYETTMQEHNIDFEPLHPGTTRPQRPAKTPALSTEAIDLWQALGRATLESDDSDVDNENNPSAAADVDIIHESYTHRFRGNGLDHIQDHLLFGPVLVDTLAHFHPEPSHIFRLWQVYLDNVNPLLKVTHTPTLQPRIIEAMSKLDILEPPFELLLFSIYSIATVSLDEDQCQEIFHASKDDTLLRFQTAGQQALSRCNIWKSASDETLAAFLLFLISLRTQTDVRSLSCMLAVLLRMAQRNGLHIEAAAARQTILEAELRRRLWWSLVQYDNRICELCNYSSSMMNPAWDCAIPNNINDFELRAEMKALPDLSQRPTEATFVLLRARLADFMRHSTPHLSFTNPTLSRIARTQYEGGINALEKEQEAVFESCDLGDPLHYMTVWTLRGSIAKLRLLEHYAISSKPSAAERSLSMSYAIGMLRCDTKIRQSSLSKGFIWYATFNFPALAYHHVLNTICKRPGEDLAEEAWQAMDENYNTFSADMAVRGAKRGVAHFFVYTAKLILEAWRVRQAHLSQHNLEATVPSLIWSMKIITDCSTNVDNVAEPVLDPDFNFDTDLTETDWSWD